MPETPWLHHTFLALPPEEHTLERARVALLPVPYDSTTTYRSGARDGPRAIIAASEHIEEYDAELDADVGRVGIYTAPHLEPHLGSPEAMAERIADAVEALWAPGRVVGVLGGEHSVTIGSVRAMARRVPGLSVLYLDAHGDLRDSYQGSRVGHANAARRVSEVCPIVQAGVRAISQEERDYIRARNLPVYLRVPGAPAIVPEEVAAHLTQDVYISIDLDVLDLSAMAATGTPEPGGLTWDQVLDLVRAVPASGRRIVGFDVVELSPHEGPEACSYLAAKLVYKVIAYATLYRKGT